jgi:hypothetical protein
VPDVPAAAGADTLVLKIAQDAWQGDAQYTVSVDGQQIGGTRTAGASQGAGQHDIVTLSGDWSAGNHKVTVEFLNDAWGGTAATDRNLYVAGLDYNGQAIAGGTATLLETGSAELWFA